MKVYKTAIRDIFHAYGQCDEIGFTILSKPKIKGVSLSPYGFTKRINRHSSVLIFLDNIHLKIRGVDFVLPFPHK